MSGENSFPWLQPANPLDLTNTRSLLAWDGSQGVQQLNTGINSAVMGGSFMDNYGAANHAVADINAQPLNWGQRLMEGWSDSSFGSGVNSLVEAGGGWGNVMGGLNALFSMYSGWKSMGLAEDQLDLQKTMFNKNYAAQRKDYENSLRDRWAARNASAQLNGRTFEGEQQFLDKRNIPA